MYVKTKGHKMNFHGSLETGYLYVEMMLAFYHHAFLSWFRGYCFHLDIFDQLFIVLD